MGYELVVPLLYDKKVAIHSSGLMHHWCYSLQLYISIYMHSCGCVCNSIHCSVLLNELGDHLQIKWMELSIGSHLFLLQYFFFFLNEVVSFWPMFPSFSLKSLPWYFMWSRSTAEGFLQCLSNEKVFVSALVFKDEFIWENPDSVCSPQHTWLWTLLSFPFPYFYEEFNIVLP